MRALYPLILLILLATAPITANSQCSNCTTMAVSGGSYTIYASQVLCIPAGVVFTGSISLQGGTLCNNGRLNGTVNFYSGKIYNATKIENCKFWTFLC